MRTLTTKIPPFVFLLLFLAQVNAQAVLDTPSIFQSLYTGEDRLLEAGLETDVRTLIRKKAGEEYQPARITLPGMDGQPLTFDIKLRARGNMRKKVCYFPPVKINFKKPDLLENGFSQSDKIKLVFQCAGSDQNRNYLLREYLIYRLYNQFSPNSFRVQLLKVNLIDSEGKSNPEELYAFIIEPEEELGARTGGVVIEREAASSTMFEKQPYQDMAAFQYMIGNTDWSPANMHNMIMLKLPEDRKSIPVPYDFDYAGLVDAHYAVPTEKLPIDNVRQRYYIGVDCPEEEADRLSKRFRALHPKMIDYAESFELLDNKDRRQVVSYLEDFFKLMDNPKVVRNIFRQ